MAGDLFARRGPQEETVFVLVRHAHAGNKRRWSGSDTDRPLSDRGRVEAQHVARLLTELGVSRLLSSPSLRCRETLDPVAVELRLQVQPSGALSADADPADLLRLLDSDLAEGAALCTHGETLATLSRAWASSWPAEATAPPDLAGTPKGACWVVEGYGTRAPAARLLGAAARS